jgi:DNA-binding transcriptional LysR family regulator
MDLHDRVSRRLKLRDLRLLLAVVEWGSMAKAAAHLNLTQSGVSRAIAETEHLLGVRLFERTPQGVEPTVYGRALVKRGAAIFDELRQGVQDIEFLADPTAGELRIGTTEFIAAAIVAPVIDRLSRQYPRMVFHVVIARDPVELYRELNERNIELAIARTTPRPALAAEHMDAEMLFDDPLIVAAGARSPWTRQRKIELAELVNEPWALGPFESFFGSLVADTFRAQGLAPPRMTVASSSVNLRNELLATGRFLTVLPSFSLRLPRRHATLKALPVELPNTRMPVAITTLKKRTPSPLVRLFMEGVRTVAKPLAKGK